MIDKVELQKLLRGRRKNRPLIVAHLWPPAVRAIGCSNVDVLLTADTIRKQKLKHPDLTLGDYLLIPQILERRLIVQDRSNSLIVAGYERETTPRLFRASIKTDWLKDGLFLQSYHRIEVRKIASIRRKGPLIRELVP